MSGMPGLPGAPGRDGYPGEKGDRGDMGLAVSFSLLKAFYAFKKTVDPFSSLL